MEVRWAASVQQRAEVSTAFPSVDGAKALSLAEIEA